MPGLMRVYKLQMHVSYPSTCANEPQFYVPGRMLFGINEAGDTFFTEDSEALKRAQEIVDLKGEPKRGWRYMGFFDAPLETIEKFVSTGKLFNRTNELIKTNLEELLRFKINEKRG